MTLAFRPPAPTSIQIDQRTIAVRHRPAAADQPTILFLPGYASDMVGAKALAIDAYCARGRLGCLRLDYSGTGESSGTFADGTLERWRDEVLAVIDGHAPDSALIIAGSSMGGWLGLHVALLRPRQVVALLGIAAAPDFTDWRYSAEERTALLRDGKLECFSADGSLGSVTHADFWRSGQGLRLLDAPIDLAMPVRLVHGDCDDVVPITVPIRLKDRLRSADVQLRIVKGGGHRLSEPHEIAAILAELAALVEGTAP